MVFCIAAMGRSMWLAVAVVVSFLALSELHSCVAVRTFASSSSVRESQLPNAYGHNAAVGEEAHRDVEDTELR